MGSDTERARLASELDRINAEIDALKRSPRGIRDDYRLRNRMADAESLARRLTELDAKQSRPGTGERTADASAWLREPSAVATDDRADLEAKADILSDQASRLTAEANRIEARVVGLRARRELRRRAGQLEADPFSPLEQAKSRVAGRAELTKDKAAPSPPPATASGPSSGAADTPRTGGTLAVPPTTSMVPTITATDSPGSLAGQLRGVLDPSSLAEIRRLEAPGSAPASLAAMESALVSLRERSSQVARSAASLRARASQAH